MSFHVNLNTTIYDLFKKQQSTDVKFICSNGEIGAHSIVLSANSTLFQNVNISVVAMMEYPKHAVLEFLTLLYKGSGDFNESSLKEMLNNFQCSYELNEIKEISNEVSFNKLDAKAGDASDCQVAISSIRITNTNQLVIPTSTVFSGLPHLFLKEMLNYSMPMTFQYIQISI